MSWYTLQPGAPRMPRSRGSGIVPHRSSRLPRARKAGADGLAPDRLKLNGLPCCGHAVTSAEIASGVDAELLQPSPRTTVLPSLNSRPILPAPLPTLGLPCVVVH